MRPNQSGEVEDEAGSHADLVHVEAGHLPENMGPVQACRSARRTRRQDDPGDDGDIVREGHPSRTMSQAEPWGGALGAEGVIARSYPDLPPRRAQDAIT